MNVPISPQAVIATAVLKAYAEDTLIEIEDISGLLLDLKNRGIQLMDVALRKVPGGVYSEDVEAFVGRQLAAGYARARSPITFGKDGLRICQRIVQEEFRLNQDGLRSLAEAMGYDVSQLSGQVLPEQNA